MITTDLDAALDSYRLVGPVVRSGEVARAVVDAIHIDNPDKEVVVDDHVAYVRVHTADECVITAATMSETLGRPFEMRELEINLASFSGQIEFGSDRVRFYLKTGG
jgi:toluene monooxygenase system protein D